MMDIIFDEDDSDAKTTTRSAKSKPSPGIRGFQKARCTKQSLDETLTREIAIAMVMGIFMISVILYHHNVLV
ncbi:MAG: hypothetical protein ACLS8R_03610 [Anaeromassilibacillus sp.]